MSREVRQGSDEEVGSRLTVWSPLGASMLNGAICVFLIAKREERS